MPQGSRRPGGSSNSNTHTKLPRNNRLTDAAEILNQSNFMEFRCDNFLVKRLHNVLVSARMQRAGNMGNVILGCTKNNLRHVAAWHQAQITQEFITVHDR